MQFFTSLFLPSTHPTSNNLNDAHLLERRVHAMVYLLGHLMWSFAILVIGVGIKGVNYVTAQVNRTVNLTVQCQTS